MFSSCALQVTRVCSLAAVLRPSAAAATGSAAFGRAGAFGARWHLHEHAIFSIRAVQSRASARSQALDATCVSRKRHQVHGDASFCAERKIPTNIGGIADKLTVSFRRANAQEAKSTVYGHTHGGSMCHKELGRTARTWVETSGPTSCIKSRCGLITVPMGALRPFPGQRSTIGP